VAGDGNCLFRAIADQLDGNPDNHPKYRKRICEYIEINRLDFEPFIEDDEPFDEYMTRMKRNATWGGQMEIQACSLAYSCNITIHQLNKPRWDMATFPASQVKTIHLSYHQGEHYSSVRKIGDENVKYAIPKEIKLVDTSKSALWPQREEKKASSHITFEEITVMEVSGCQNREFVRQLLLENWGDINATIEFIFTVGPDNIEFQHDYLQEKKLGTDAKRHSSPPTITTTITTITSTTSTTSTTTSTTKSEEPELENKDKSNKKNKKNGAEVDTNSEKENQPFVHPKLAKFHGDNLSNKERKEKARIEKLTQQPPEKPFPTSTIPAEVVDVTDIVQDLGSMQI